MKPSWIALLVGMGLGVGFMWILPRRDSASEKFEAKVAGELKEGEAEMRGPLWLKVSVDSQKRMGLSTEFPRHGEWKPEQIAYGRVLDNSGLVALWGEIKVLAVSLQATSNDYVRLKLLYSQNQNASLQALEGAEALYRRDILMLEAARARLMMGWGKGLAEISESDGALKGLVDQKMGVAKVELPDATGKEPEGVVKVAMAANPDRWMAGENWGEAPATDAQTLGRSYLMLIRSNAPPAGTAVEARWGSGGEAESGWWIPAGAVLRHEGVGWFFVRRDDSWFERVEILDPLGTRDAYFIRKGLDATNQVVVTGAQLLLSEQLKGTGVEE